MKSLRTMGGVAALLLVWTVAAGAVPSKYVRQQAVTKSEKVLKDAADTLARYEELKADGKLDEMRDGQPRSLGIARRLRGFFDDGLYAYDEAIAEGWTPDDAEMTKARDALEAARAKFEAAGMWVAVRFGEPPIPGNYRNRLEVIRDQVFEASVLLKAKEVDKATELITDAEKRLKGVQTEAENAADDGDKRVISPKHPALKRTIEEIARLKAGGASVMADTAKAREAVEKDIKEMLDMRAKMEDIFRGAQAATNIYGNYKDAKDQYDKAQALFKAWKAEHKAALEKLVKTFGEKYGTKSQDVENKLAELLGHRVDTTPSPGYAWDQLTEGLAKTDEAAKTVAKKLLDSVAEVLDKIGDYSEDIRLDLYDREKPKLDAAAEFDPDNADVKARLAKFDADRAACAAAIEKAIDARVWPGHTKNFGGPGKVEELAASSLAYLKAEAKNGDEIVAVRVTGNWEGGEKDALGRLINYQLPILVACRLKADKDAGKDVVKVFELSMITLDLKKAPPWKYSATLGSWRMRYSKVK